MFNEAEYAKRVEDGELTLIVKKSRITKMTHIRNYVPGTESQELHIVNKTGDLLVKAHRFLRPDGELAASGLIDPKRIYDNGEIVGLASLDEE